MCLANGQAGPHYVSLAEILVTNTTCLQCMRHWPVCVWGRCSVQDDRIMLVSRSVHTKVPTSVRPSLSTTLMSACSHDRSLARPGLSWMSGEGESKLVSFKTQVIIVVVAKPQQAPQKKICNLQVGDYTPRDDPICLNVYVTSACCMSRLFNFLWWMMYANVQGSSWQCGHLFSTVAEGGRRMLAL